MLRNFRFQRGVSTPLLYSRGSTRLISTAQSSRREDEEKAYKARADAILRVWPGDYRLGINRLMRHIQNDVSFKTDAKNRYIDDRNWSRFANSFRRNLIKEPLVTLDNNHKLFVNICKHLKPLSSLTTTLMDTPIALESDEKEGNNNQENKKKKKNGKNWTRSKEGNAFEQLVTLLRNHIMETAEKELHGAITAYRTLINTSDLKNPEEWYPYARLSKRKIIYHGGPTNSGKTYKALLRLKDADPEKGGGLYCGPLRLLALEVYENLNKQGVYTNLVTGQEKREVPFATHTSSTLEMVNVNNSYDVAVVDEIQMIADKQRGYAWTRALQGLRANEIHVCGGLEAYEVVKNLVESMGDDFELERYERLGALDIQEESLRGDYGKIEPGDAIVAFSRADIFSIRRQVEKLTPYKCSVIYGQLPPETRSMQARLFNEEQNQVLVASDAIGMGLNLNIRRIVFHTTIKRGAEAECYFVDPSNVKQIAGRAGRLSSKWKTGLVTAWQEQDLAYVRAVMQWDIPQIESAGVFPSVEQIELFSEQLEKGETRTQAEAAADAEAEGEAVDGADRPQSLVPIVTTDTNLFSSTPAHVGSRGRETSYSERVRLSTILGRFIELSQIDGRYFLCDHDEMVMVSNWLHTLPLTLPERFVFANAPVNTNDSLNMMMLYQFAATYSQRRPVACNIRLLRQKPKDVEELAQLCSKHNTLDLYIWLSLRFPKYFVERDSCLEQKLHAVTLIEQSLEDKLGQAAYSHSMDYMNIRKRLLDRTLDGLPPLSFGDVRTTTRANLSMLEPEIRELYPHMEAEGAQAQAQAQAARGTAKSQRGYGGKSGRYNQDSRRRSRSYR